MLPKYEKAHRVELQSECSLMFNWKIQVMSHHETICDWTSMLNHFVFFENKYKLNILIFHCIHWYQTNDLITYYPACDISD